MWYHRAIQIHTFMYLGIHICYVHIATCFLNRYKTTCLYSFNQISQLQCCRKIHCSKATSSTVPAATANCNFTLQVGLFWSTPSFSSRKRTRTNTPLRMKVQDKFTPFEKHVLWSVSFFVYGRSELMSMWNTDRIWWSSWSKDDGSISLKHPLSLQKKNNNKFNKLFERLFLILQMQHVWLPTWTRHTVNAESIALWPRHNKCHAIGLQDGIHIGFPVIPQLLSYDTSGAKPTHGAFLKASMCGCFVEKMPFSSRSWRMISENPIPISIYTVDGNALLYIYIYPSLIPFSNDNESYKIIDVKPRICSAIQGHQSTHLLLQVPFDVGWCDVTTGMLQI